jgi:hypothetical protein
VSADVHLRALRRALREALPEAVFGDDSGGSLEASSLAEEPPRTAGCDALEENAHLPRPVGRSVGTHFAAFLDGTQESRVVHHVGAVPIVHGRVAAVVRVRSDRRLTTWKTPVIRRAIYTAPTLLPPPLVAALAETRLNVIDILQKRDLDGAPHPHQLQRFAVLDVQRDRELAERELAEQWCSDRDAPLFADGGLPKGPVASQSPDCVGVVKSHHTLYLPTSDVSAVLGLHEGERSGVFRIARSWGGSVASWYLRLREDGRRGPMWGLVRVEVTETGLTTADAIAARADEVSRWILADRAPLAMPDGRWDRMVYGIRDCEEYLRAVTSWMPDVRLEGGVAEN